MAFHIHRAERTDLLADGLGELLSTPPADPFAEDLVVVPARGVERWLSQRLSHVLGRGAAADGVCAAVAFRSPASLVAEITGTHEDDPWSPEAMTWPLLEVVDASLAEPWASTLAAHLGYFSTSPEEKELRQGRRYAVVRRLAGLFASYARQRPGLLADWMADRTSILADDLAWQPHLWRRLVEVTGIEPPHIRHSNAVAQLRDSGAEQLPARVSLFGHTRLSATDIELLDALAAHHEVHLWLPHPSDDLWQSLFDVHGAVDRRNDTTHRRARHPLLATLGRDVRELQRSLPGNPATDEFLPGSKHPDTLLGWLQSDISANAVRPQGRSHHPSDRSVQVHSCHSPARQVDVLREVLLGLLADDETLEPRDILVMCPDIETYAPLIAADFGLGEVVPDGHPAHRLRVRLADRSLVQTNPLLGVASDLLALAGSRATASEVLNLVQSEPVRARFGFTDDDLDDITAWVREASIRWGFDKEHREPYGLSFIHHTWRFGMNRILAGVALSDDSAAWIDATLPLDDVGSNRVELAGRLAEFVDRLQQVVGGLTGTRPLCEWMSNLTAGITLLTRVADDDAWQFSQLERECRDITARAGMRVDTILRLADVQQLLHRQLAGRPTRANFRTGTLTACTMVPMRSVPHRVVCLVGLDDTVFPRIGVVDGDDALAREPRTGERDVRSEDRQLLLDAVCAATETLVVTYTGANEFTGQPRPPAVPLAELLDALNMTTEGPVGETIVARHPLQPFDIRNVIPAAVVEGRPEPFTFDATVLRAARAGEGDRREWPRFAEGMLLAPPSGDVSLAELTGFFKDPVKGFFRALDYTLPADVEGISDAIPVDINALEEWTVGDRMLADMLRGLSPQRALNAEWCRGTLPPGQIGWRTARKICDRATTLAQEAAALRTAPASPVDIDIELGQGRRLTGTVAPVYGDRLVSVTYSKLDGKHLLAGWIPLLALAAHDPSQNWTAVCIGRRPKGEGARRETIGGPNAGAIPNTGPIELLRDLVAIYDAGRREPIPLPLKTSYAWAQARMSGGDPVYAARFKWKSSDNFPGEDSHPAHARVWKSGAALKVLLDPVRPGEAHPGESTRLGAYAARVWLPMLQCLGRS
jgi:exodeoxyribonuclease V gamma subunit